MDRAVIAPITGLDFFRYPGVSFDRPDSFQPS